MIPKIIHYCWFGGKPLPKLAKKCIRSWKKYCPDYEIKEWNESNFDLNYNTYVKEAYEAKKWAFVTDVVRLYALVNYGGIYMDTDVEVLKSLDVFLSHEAFSGFEAKGHISTGIMAAEKRAPIMLEFLDDYKGAKFKKDDGSLDMTTNVKRITDICLKHGLILSDSFQNIHGYAIYPSDYFCPKDLTTQKTNLTENSHTIHHFDGSWLPRSQKFKKCLTQLFGIKFMKFLSKIKRIFVRKK